MRARDLPVVWTFFAYQPGGKDCRDWGLRTVTPDSLQNITIESRRAKMVDRVHVMADRDIVLRKRMPSRLFETSPSSLVTFRCTDTVIGTGGSTSS